MNQESRKRICQEIVENVDNKETLFAMLEKVFVDTEVYDERLSVSVSQSLVQALIDKFDGENGSYYKDLLLEIHNRFGFHNGGCILFDYYTKKPTDKIKLLKSKKIYQEYKRNQIEVLNQKECPSPRSIYRLNYDDMGFLNKLTASFPKFVADDNISESTDLS